MNESESRSGKRTLLLAATFSIVIAAVVFFTQPSSDKPTWKIDVSELNPGGEISFEIGKRPVVVSVPEGEEATFGSFQISSPVVGFHSGSIERDGSLETIWVDDLNGDGREDGMILIRAGGSGSYVTLFALEGTAAGFVLRTLPDLPVDDKPGYRGHDAVEVRNGVILQSFPTYHNTGNPQVDRQSTVDDGIRGESPVKNADHSNADPSGRTMRFRYDYEAGDWKPVT